MLDISTLRDVAEVGEFLDDETTLGDDAKVGDVFVEALESSGNGSMRCS